MAFAFAPLCATLTSIPVPIARGLGLSPVPTFRATPGRDVAVRRPGGIGGERLQPVVGLTREIDLRVAIAVEVVARDPHTVHLKVHPAVVSRVQRRRDARRNTPELLLAVGR